MRGFRILLFPFLPPLFSLLPSDLRGLTGFLFRALPVRDGEVGVADVEEYALFPEAGDNQFGVGDLQIGIHILLLSQRL